MISTSCGSEKRAALVDGDELPFHLSEEETGVGVDRVQRDVDNGAEQLPNAEMSDSGARGLVMIHHLVKDELVAFSRGDL